MAMQVTLNIREETYRYAEWLSRISGRSIEDILSTLADNTLSVFKHVSSKREHPVRYNLSDDV